MRQIGAASGRVDNHLRRGFYVDPPPRSSLIRNENDVGAHDLVRALKAPGSAVPGEGLGVLIGFDEKAINSGLEIHDTSEDTTFEPLPGQFGEEPLDGVEPGRRGRGEVGPRSTE
jgi:hypothetical protein